MIRIRRKTAEEVEAVRKKIYDYSARLNVTLGSVTDLGDSVMRDCVVLLRRRGLWRLDVKRHGNMAIREGERLLGCYRMNTAGVDRLYLDFLDTIQDDIRMDMDRLYYAIKLQYDRAKMADSEIKARVMIARILCEMNGRGFERYKALLEDATRSRLGVVLQPLDPSGVLFQWRLVSELVCGADGVSLVERDQSVTTGVEVICRKVFDLDWLEERAEKVVNN